MNLLQKFAGAFALACATQACAVGSLADLTVYDRTEGRRLPVYWHEGRAYVAGKPGNEYQVSVRNRAGEDVLAVVSVDGVNVVSGETADTAQSGYVLSPYRSLDIQGWRKSLAQTAAFYFTSLADSYAVRTGRPGNVGVIGVALFRKKQEPQPIGQIAPSISRKEAAADAVPAPKPSAQAAESAAAAGVRSRIPDQQERIGTGHGRRETSHAQYVAFERASTAPAETITIYYDSRANLLARGILREPVPVAPLPRPFPGFAPDPAG